jgi:hypothetical protein
VRLESLSGGRFFQKPSFNPAENRRQGAGLGKMSSKEVPPACILKQVVDLGPWLERLTGLFAGSWAAAD